MRKRKAEDYLLCFLLGNAYIFAISRSVLAPTVVQFSHLTVFLTGLGFFSLFMIMFYNRYTVAGSSILLLLAMLLYGLSLDEHNVQRSFAYELLQLARGYTAYKEAYALPITVLICLFVSLFTAIFLYGFYSFYMLASAGVATFAVNRIMSYRQDNEAFLIYMCCFCVLLVLKMNHTVNKQGRAAVAALLAIPVCLCSVGLAWRIPVQDGQGGSRTLSHVLEQPVAAVNDFFSLTFNPKYFSFQTTGFTGYNGRLGGPITINNREVMRVQSPSRVYLSGATKNVYTGYSWINSLDDDALEKLQYPGGESVEFLETAHALMRSTNRLRLPLIHNKTYRSSTETYIEALLPFDEVRVIVRANPTAAVFKPPNNLDSVFVDTNTDYIIQYDAAGDGSTQTPMTHGTEYIHQFLDIDRQQPIIAEILSESRHGYYMNKTDVDPYAAAKLFSHLVFWSGGNNDFYRYYGGMDYLISDIMNQYASECLSAYAENVYETYTILPDHLPQRVYDLAQQITVDCVTDYERVKAIEAYLVEFPYTLTPQSIPSDYDFVDYFLFEGKEGYCTYYASAMAVLSRCVGLPSRYKEGYLLPPKPDQDGLYTVTNKQAHAWAEVYMEGYGWLIVEATAPYNYIVENRPISISSPLFTPQFREDPRYMEYLTDFGFEERVISTPAPSNAMVTQEAPEEGIHSFIVIPMLAAVFLVIIALLLGLFVMIHNLFEKWQLYKVYRLDANRQVQRFYKGLLKITSYHSFPLCDGETPRAYGQRVGKLIAFQNDTVFMRDLTDLYYKAKYSPHSLAETECAVMRESYFEKVQNLKNTLKKPAYFYLRYFKHLTLLSEVDRLRK